MECLREWSDGMDGKRQDRQRRADRPRADDAELTSAMILRRARRIARLSQSEFAVRLGVGQTQISLYERGLRAPSVSTLERLVDAAGLRLTWDLTHGGSGGGPLAALGGPIGRRLLSCREEVVTHLRERSLLEPRVVGDVASGRDGPNSRLFILITPEPATKPTPMTLLSASGAISVLTGSDARVFPVERIGEYGVTEADVAQAISLETVSP